MYVRWIVRGHKNSDVANVVFHDAYLVESYRDEEGEPRQRTICYLGNLREIGDAIPVIESELFLIRAMLILTNTPELSQQDCDQVLVQLRRKLPAMTIDEMRVGFANTLRWYIRWWRDNGIEINRMELHELIDHAHAAMEQEAKLVLLDYPNTLTT
jgi:hypothetical protein